MARNITITFEDGTTHQYAGVPDTITPDEVHQRAAQEFGKQIVNIDGGKAAVAETQQPKQRLVDKFKSLTAGETATGALSNIPSSAGNMISGFAHAVAHPIDTATGVVNTAAGEVNKLLPESIQRLIGAKGSQSEAAANQMNQYVAGRYGSIDNFNRALATDPVGVAADVSTIFTGGGAALSKVGKLANAPKLAEAGQVATASGNAVNPMQLVTKPVVAAKKAIRLSRNEHTEERQALINWVNQARLKSHDEYSSHLLSETALSPMHIDAVPVQYSDENISWLSASVDRIDI